MAFRWGANNGPLLVVFWSSPHQLEKMLSEFDPLWQNFLDLHMNHTWLEARKTGFSRVTAQMWSLVLWKVLPVGFISLKVSKGQNKTCYLWNIRKWWWLKTATNHHSNSHITHAKTMQFLQVVMATELPRSPLTTVARQPWVQCSSEQQAQIKVEGRAIPTS